jgi:prepilin peptidase CpaA
MLTQIENQVAIQWGAVIGASLAALVCDLKNGRIPNWLTLPLAATGLMFAACTSGPPRVGEAIVAWVIVALPYIVLFALNRGGAGDAKMMGAIGAWLGVGQGILVLACVSVVGGALALLRIAVHGQRGRLFRNLFASLYIYTLALTNGRSGWELLKQEQTDEDPQQVTIPYGVAIFLGVCLGAIVVHVWIR